MVSTGIDKKLKYKKYHKQKISLVGVTSSIDAKSSGEFVLRALEAGRISSKQIEAARRAARRMLRRGGKLWTCIFPHWPVSAKPLAVRMGRGKGSIGYFAAAIRAGTVLLEISGVAPQQAFYALEAAGKKLPVRSIVSRRSNLL